MTKNQLCDKVFDRVFIRDGEKMQSEEQEIQEKEEKTVDLFELFEVVRGKLLWIAAFAMLGAAIGYAVSSFLMTPLYSATAVLYVNNQKTVSYQNEINTSALNASARLVPTYEAIAKTKTAMRRAIEEKGIKGYTPDELLSMVSTGSSEQTGVFTITVEGEDQFYVADIANAVAEVSTLEISKYVEGTTASIIDSARVPEQKSYPSDRRNTLIGGLVGAFICGVYVVVRSFVDVRIKKSEDFSKVLSAPILGVIPNMAETHGGHGYGYGYGSRDAKSEKA